MTITIGTLRRWQPAVLEEGARTLLRHRDALTSLQDEVTGSTPPISWHGEAADMAALAHGKVNEYAQRITGEVASVWAVTLDAADSLTSLRAALTEAENLAHHHEFTIHDDGTTASTRQQDLSRISDITDPDMERRAVELELRDRVGELQRRADDVDAKLARVLGNAHDDLLTTRGTLQEAAHAGARAGDLEVTPPPASTAGANATWWKSLSEADRNMVRANKPEWIGNLDGVPARDRHAANQARLTQMRDALHQELSSLQGPGRATPQQVARAGEVGAKLRAIDAIDRELGNAGHSPKDPFPRQLLMLDLWGDFPKAAVSTGDVDAAEHVAVQTPGIRSTVAGSLEGNQNEMTALHEDSNQKVAAISWIGYEPPQTLSVNDTFANDRAREGSEDLARLYQGINASRGDGADPHLTALGHSYGGVTTEYALTKEGTGVDDAVVYGTPGHAVSDTTELEIPRDSFYTLSSDKTAEPTLGIPHVPWGDWLEWIGDGDERGDIAGAQALSADANGEETRGVEGHSDYMIRGTTSYANVLNVATDNTGEVVREET